MIRCSIRAPLVLVLSLTGCTETIRFDHQPLAELVAITVEPRDAVMTITELAGQRASFQYRAIGAFGDGSTRDITEHVTWAIDRDVLGAFGAPGRFVASHAAAGYGTVAARVDNLAGTGDLLVTIDATIIDSTFPPPAAGLFDAATPVVTGDPTRSPALAYPASGTVLPSVIASTLFQVEPGAGNDAFELTFESGVLRLRVETGSDRWRADGDIQRLLAEAAAIDPLRIGLRATSAAASETIYAGDETQISFTRDLGDTPLFYWSAATSGVMRGAVHVGSATKLYPSGTTSCVGCHALGRNGRSVAVARDAGSGNPYQLETVELMTQQPEIPASPTRPASWSTYSPDGTRIVVASDGVLVEYDALSGAQLGLVPLPSNRYATHPDWSPDGKTLAIALTAQQPTAYDVRAASIAVLAYVNGAWGSPQTLVAGSASSNNYFPRWSPSGDVLAFVRATTGSRGATSAELAVVAASGGAPRLLELANRRVGATDLTDLANTMPSWAPAQGPLQFLAFASARPYGKVVVNGRSQIWVTSIDLTNTVDPSTPAFWLPCQDVTVVNNTPVWAREVITL